MSSRSTLIRPPPDDPRKSNIENLLELTRLSDIDPDLFTNARPLWHPPGARGVYGGSVIAQSLSAAYPTVAPDFDIHSMHCYFVLAGAADVPIIYHVERVRSGRSFATRTVQARQRAAVIFTATMSFVRAGAGGARSVAHARGPAAPSGAGAPRPPAEEDGEGGAEDGAEDEDGGGVLGGAGGPFESRRLGIVNAGGARPEAKLARAWVRARGRVSDQGGRAAHLAALAYLSDSYFLGTVARVQNLFRGCDDDDTATAAAADDDNDNDDDYDTPRHLRHASAAALQRLLEDEDPEAARAVARGEQPPEHPLLGGRPELGMMVSLDHTIYFHDTAGPGGFRADEWMLQEMESPWAGDGRGLVLQRVYTSDGRLVATCVQEGVVRLKQEGQESSKL
ncbi:thioesterase-like superfamily-domain-containing protein [Lineolata rhizophorae]|uniref:Thioesterase-like superfamily-domain-containing protein n=1 Tax=Lineolata rhizophorae TaxID=578093 RepID=A0A6A6PDQ7_9PEZI|nr:thioesterase-like superfamily-domain-containing protein [Lineolata rhizophorae]